MFKIFKGGGWMRPEGGGRAHWATIVVIRRAFEIPKFSRRLLDSQYLDRVRPFAAPRRHKIGGKARPKCTMNSKISLIWKFRADFSAYSAKNGVEFAIHLWPTKEKSL